MLEVVDTARQVPQLPLGSADHRRPPHGAEADHRPQDVAAHSSRDDSACSGCPAKSGRNDSGISPPFAKASSK